MLVFKYPLVDAGTDDRVAGSVVVLLKVSMRPSCDFSVVVDPFDFSKQRRKHFEFVYYRLNELSKI